MSLTCHCYSCNVECSAKSYISSNNEDEQNLILQICKRIFEAIQDEHISTEISYNGSTMKHRQICNIGQVENCINKTFNQLFNDNLLFKEIKQLPIGVWRIEFKWTGFDNDSLIKGLLKILGEWYHDSFAAYLRVRDNQKASKLKNEGELKLLDNLKNYLPGFNYLFEHSWKSNDNDNNGHEGDFIFASSSGIFIAIKAKWLLNAENERNLISDVRTQALKYKNKALKEFNGKYIAILGATFVNNFDEIGLEKATLEFIGNDEIIARGSFDFSQSKEGENNKNQIRNDIKGESSSISISAAGIVAAATTGYMIYKALTRNNNSK